MLAKELTKRVEAYVESHKTVSFSGKTLEQDLNVILEAVDEVNSLTELDTKVGGELLDEAKLPSWVAPFVYPVKVAVLPGFQYPDVVERPQPTADWVFDIPKVTVASHRIAQLFKTVPDFRSVRDLRGDLAMISAVHFAVNGWVRQDGDELFYPVPLVSGTASVLGTEWGTMQLDRMIELFFARSFNIPKK